MSTDSQGTTGSVSTYKLGGFGQFGQENWPGLAKLIEEAGETLQVAGKIVAFGGTLDHPSGYNTLDKFHEELADLIAAIEFVINHNPLLRPKIKRRAKKKYETFCRWHIEKTWNNWKPGDEKKDGFPLFVED